MWAKAEIQISEAGLLVLAGGSQSCRPFRSSVPGESEILTAAMSSNRSSIVALHPTATSSASLRDVLDCHDKSMELMRFFILRGLAYKCLNWIGSQKFQSARGLLCTGNRGKVYCYSKLLGNQTKNNQPPRFSQRSVLTHFLRQ